MNSTNGDTNTLRGYAKTVASFQQELKTTHDKEFALSMFEGYLVCIHREAFAQLGAEDTLKYDVGSYGQYAMGSLKLFNCGYLTPQFRTKLSADGSGFESGDRFCQQVFVLAGGEYIDKTSAALPEIHDYDDQLERILANIGTRRSDAVTESYHGCGTGLYKFQRWDDAYRKQLFDLFPNIPEEERSDHVIYLIGTGLALTRFAQSNLNMLNDSEAKGSTSTYPQRPGSIIDPHLYVLPNTFEVDMRDNTRLATDRAFVRPLVTGENELMLSRKYVEYVFGAGAPTNDPVLHQLHTDYDAFFCENKKDCMKLPCTPTMISLITSYLNHEYITAFPVKGGSKIEALRNRLVTLESIYFKGDSAKKGVPQQDELATMVLAQQTVHGVSPIDVHTFREDAKSLKDAYGSAGNHTPWPISDHVAVEENIRRGSTRAVQNGENEDGNSQLKLNAVMSGALMDMKIQLSIGDHVYHADYFRNILEMVTEHNLKTNTEKKLEDPRSAKGNSPLSIYRTKGMCGALYHKHGFSIVETTMAAMQFNPCMYKRSFIANALHVTKDNQHPKETMSCSPKNTHDKSESAGAVCHTCNAHVYYDASKQKGCLCYLITSVGSVLFDVALTTKFHANIVWDMLNNQRDDLDYRGEFTKMSTVHTVPVVEQTSMYGLYGSLTITDPNRMLKRKGWKKGGEGVGTTEQVPGGSDEPTMVTEDAKSTANQEDDSDFKAQMSFIQMDKLVKDVKSAVRGSASLYPCQYTATPNMDTNYIHETCRIPWAGENNGNNESFFWQGAHLDTKMLVSDALLAHSGKYGDLQNVHSNKARPTMMTDNATLSEDAGGEVNWIALSMKKPTIWEDDATGVSNCKKPKLSEADEQLNRVSNLTMSVFYAILDGQSDAIQETATLSDQVKTVLDNWPESNGHIRMCNTLLAEVLGKKNFVNTVMAKAVQNLLSDLPKHIQTIHAAVAQQLGKTPQELQEMTIVHGTKHPKREMVGWLDTRSTDRVVASAIKKTTLGIFRHMVPCRAACNQTEARQTQAASAVTLIKNNCGPHAVRTVDHNIVYVPTVVKTCPDDNIPVLKINPTPVTDLTVETSLCLPIKVKMTMGCTEFDRSRFKAASEGAGAGMIRRSDPIRTPAFKGYQPQPFLAGSGKVAEQKDVPRTAAELAELLRQPGLSFQDMTITPENHARAVEYLASYLSNRTNATKTAHTHTLIVGHIQDMVQDVIRTVLKATKETVTWFHKQLSHKRQTNAYKMRLKAIEKCTYGREPVELIKLACQNNPQLTVALSIVVIASELYAPGFRPRNGDDSFEANHAFISAITAASLRLYMGNGDGRQAVREDKDYQTRITPMQTTFLDYPIQGKSKSVRNTTYTDTNNVQSSLVSTLLTMSSFTTEHDTTKAFTSLKGGIAMTRERSPFYAHIVRPGMFDVEPCTIVKRPHLHFVNDGKGSNMQEQLVHMIESMHVTEFVEMMMENVDKNVDLLLKVYQAMGVVKSEHVSRAELLEQCLRVHGVETDSVLEREIYESRLFPHIYAICSNNALEIVAEDEYCDDDDADTDDY